jgi:hypothetical protein
MKKLLVWSISVLAFGFINVTLAGGVVNVPVSDAKIMPPVSE